MANEKEQLEKKLENLLKAIAGRNYAKQVLVREYSRIYAELVALREAEWFF